jgi:hypothetical protein
MKNSDQIQIWKGMHSKFVDLTGVYSLNIAYLQNIET